MRESSRRRVLAALAASGVGAVAGCASGENATDTTVKTTATEASTRTTTTGRESEATTEEATERPTVTDDERVAIAKTVANELDAGEYGAVHDRLADAVTGDISERALQRAWERLAEPLGAYRGSTVADRGTTNGYPYVVLRLSFERGVRRLFVAFEGEAIVGIRIRVPDDAYDPPAYADQSALVERSVTVPSPVCDLGGTLTLPKPAAANGSTVPGVVLVHGTGPSGRDQQVGPNRPFADLALGLATKGVAVLRYDKRTHACDVSRADGLDLGALTVDDAVTALDRLREQPEVGPVAVVGHSQGGYAAPRIADRADPDGMAGLAAPSGSFADLVAYQTQYLAALDDEVTDAEQSRIDAVQAAADRIEAGDYGDDEVILNFHAAFWSDVASYDPPALAAELDLPRFLAFGGRDWQVPVDRARPPWADALDDASTTMRTYAAVNHHFVPGEGEPTLAEYYEPGSVAEALVDDLAAWASDL